MSSDDAIRTAANAQGLRIKRNNLIAASLSGFILLLISFSAFPHSAFPHRASCLASWQALFTPTVLNIACTDSYCTLVTESSPSNTWCITPRCSLPMPPATSISRATRGEWSRFFVANAIPFLVLAVDLPQLAGSPEYFRASRSITWLLRRFTGARTWADGSRGGSGLRRGITCCTTRTTRTASTCSCRFLIGSSIRSARGPQQNSPGSDPSSRAEASARDRLYVRVHEDLVARHLMAGIYLIAGNGRGHRFLFFLQQRAIRRQQSQLFLDNLFGIFRQIVNDGLDANFDAAGRLGGIQIAEFEK